MAKTAPIAKAWVSLIPTLDGASKQIERELSGSGQKSGRAFGVGFGKFAGPLIGAATGAAAVNFSKDAINAASDLGESLNAINVVYGEQAGLVNAIGEGAADSMGLSQRAFNETAVQFSGFAKTVAGAEGDVVDVLSNITGRAADFASVMNLEVADAAQLFQSGLAGETEPLRRFSIDMSAAAVEAYALESGLAGSKSELTESLKVQARYALLMQETNKYAGDFANTSEDLANVQRRLSGEWENLQARLGEALLPAMTSVTSWLVDDALPAIETFLEDIGDPATPVGKLADSIQNLGGEIGEFLTAPTINRETSILEWLGNELDDLVNNEFPIFLDGLANVTDAVTRFLSGEDRLGFENSLSEQFSSKDGLFTQGPFTQWLDGNRADNKQFAESVDPINFTDSSNFANSITAPSSDIGPLSAGGTQGGGVGSGNIIVNGDIYATDVKDIQRKSVKNARGASLTGGRANAL